MTPDPRGDHIEDIMVLHPGLYPRNHVDRGYVVYENRERIDGLLLPNLEHPQRRVRESSLVTGRSDHWWRQPLAWSCDWFDKAWYPRLAHYGVLPDGLPEDDRVLVSCEDRGIYMVWKGLWPTPRELPDRLPMAGYEPGDELVGIEAFVNHLPIEALDGAPPKG